MSDDLITRINLIKADSNSSTENEAATSQRILLPILLALGWDIFNTLEVFPQYSVENKRIDYALRINGRNKIFLEIKKPSEDLEKHQEQLLNYSFREGVTLAILTNGIAWWFYLPLKEGSWEQRKFYAIDLIEQSVEDASEKFTSLLSKQNIISDNAIRYAEHIYKGKQKDLAVRQNLPKAWQKLISEPDETLVELVNDTLEKISGYRAEKNEIIEFIKVSQLSFSDKPQQSKPTKAVSFPQNAQKMNIDQIIDLRFSKIIQGTFLDENSMSWRGILDIGLKIAAKRGIDINILAKELALNIKTGSYTDEGYKPVVGTTFSVQGKDATDTSQSIIKLAKLLRCKFYILFTWGEKSPNYGKKAYIEWQP